MTRIVLRIDFDDERYIGHGRIELLELIGEHGSIAKAAAAMGMSYKRAWYLIEEFSGVFSDALVERQHGGKGGGAAHLTPFGAELVTRYRAMEAIAAKALAKPVQVIEKRLAAPRKASRKP